MQEYWEIYMKSLEGKPASIQFNAGISMDLEDTKHKYPNVAFVKAKLKEVNDKGLLTKKEEPEILFLEDKLEASLLKFRLGKYVGRIISDGFVTFIYYVPYTYDWNEFIKASINEHKHYEITNGFETDYEWNYYNNLLYPNAKEWQILQNHKVCENLKKAGDKSHIKRMIEHKVYYDTNENKELLQKELINEGFEIKEDITNEDNAKGFVFTREDKPFYNDIDDITLNLIDISEKYEAQYDGWETSVVKI